MKLFWIVGVPSPKPQDLYLPITEAEILCVLWLVKMSLKKLGKTNWMGQLTDPGGSPLCEPYKHVPSQKGTDFAPCWVKWIWILPILVWSQEWFSRRWYMNVSKWIRKKEICELAFLFKEWCHNFLEVGAENGCEKWHFLVWNRVGIWRTGRHTPTKTDMHCAALYFCGWAFYNCFCILRDFELIFAIFRTSIAFASTEHYWNEIFYNLEQQKLGYCSDNPIMLFPFKVLFFVANRWI